MARRSSSGDGITLIITLIISAIGAVFIAIGYFIMFFGKVHKYNLWNKFWKTFPFLLLANIGGYFLLPKSQDFAIVLFAVSWLFFLVYWSFVIFEKEHEEREEITSQIGVETANCPYCGESLSKFPYRKTRCKRCGNYMYVRTRPSDKKRVLVREENIEELETQWSKKKDKKQIAVIDVGVEMDGEIAKLVERFSEFCNYKELLKIEEKDRFPICKYIWENWEYRGTEKKLRKNYPQYDKDLLYDITIIEQNRLHIYYKMREFKELYDDLQPSLVNCGFAPYPYSTGVILCTIDSMIDIFNWYLQQYEEVGSFPNYLLTLSGPFKENFPDCNVYMLENNDLKKVTPQELKQFCKKNNYKYPYKN